MKQRFDAFIGRWLYFHKGHLEIITKVFNQNQRPILIMIMDTDEDPPVLERVQSIKDTLDRQNIPHYIVIIPPIASINWGRKVGYETNYIEVDDEIQQISSTQIKQKIQNKENWQKDIP